MIEKILLATDGPGAWLAAAAVADFASSSQSPVEVEVLHVNEVEYQTAAGADAPGDPFPEPRRLVESVVEELQRRGVAASGKVRHGMYDDVADDIVDEAVVCGAQLIAMSCRPHSRLRFALAGSVSRAVIDRAGCPVMVVREPGTRL